MRLKGAQSSGGVPWAPPSFREKNRDRAAVGGSCVQFLGCLRDPAPHVTPVTPILGSSPAPPASPDPLCPHYLYLTGVCPPPQVCTHSHSHTQISGTNGPRVLRDPCPGSLLVSAPRVPVADKATSCLLYAWCSGSGPFLALSLSLSLSFFFK